MAVRRESLPGLQGQPEFDRFEQAAFDTLARTVRDESKGPLLTIDEDDLLIHSDATYFMEITRRYTPHGATRMVQMGELTDADIEGKQRRSRAMIRATKSDMFAERIMTSTYAVDTSRALLRTMIRGDVVQVESDDTEETLRHRVGDYVTDMLRAGRETRLLRGAAMLRTTDKIRAKFDTDSGARVELTKLAGVNSRKKVGLWLGQLFTVSRGFERVTPETKAKLLTYAASRPLELSDEFDLMKLLTDRANSSS